MSPPILYIVRQPLDPLSAGASRDLESEDAESWWLPIIGPTAFLLARRMFRLAAVGPFRVAKIPLAASLGISPMPKLFGGYPLDHYLDRLQHFKVIKLGSDVDGEQRVKVCAVLPAVRASQLARQRQRVEEALKVEREMGGTGRREPKGVHSEETTRQETMLCPTSQRSFPTSVTTSNSSTEQ